MFRTSYNPREGPHIYTVTYNDDGTIRPLYYRLSVSEVILQYGDPRPPLHRKSVRTYFTYATLFSLCFDNSVFCIIMLLKVKTHHTRILIGRPVCLV